MTRRRRVAGFVALSIGLVGVASCDSPESNATSNAEAQAGRFWAQVSALVAPTQADVARLVPDHSAVVLTAPNPLRGGSSVLVEFTATGGGIAHGGLGHHATEDLCYRLDLRGVAVTAEDWNLAPCGTGGLPPVLPPELPESAPASAVHALDGLTARTATTETAIRRALLRIAPTGFDVTTARGTMPDDIVMPTYGYQGGPVVVADLAATTGMTSTDCLLVWSWAEGYVVWHPDLRQVCLDLSGAPALRLGSVPMDSTRGAVAAGRRG